MIDLKTLEARVFNDICIARESYNIIRDFINPLMNASNSHYLNRDWPLISHIMKAAIDCTISSLGRLLQPSSRNKECTLLKYKNQIVQSLQENNSQRVSDYSKECFEKLNDRKYMKLMKNEIHKFQRVIFPLRDKIISHSDIDINADMPRYNSIINMLSECVSFVEEIHRTCHSAYDDAGMSGEYIFEQTKKVSDDWIKCLLQRQTN